MKIIQTSKYLAQFDTFLDDKKYKTKFLRYILVISRNPHPKRMTVDYYLKKILDESNI